jgi:hypothetical protein
MVRSDQDLSLDIVQHYNDVSKFLFLMSQNVGSGWRFLMSYNAPTNVASKSLMYPYIDYRYNVPNNA